jgi:peptide/nickel transport system substrate-binding protein
MERVEWHIIPDAATASAALQSGEVDWWEIALPDLIPALQKNSQVRVVNADPYGVISLLRFNCIQPPFNNAKLRHAVLAAIDQNDYMTAISGGDPRAYSTCYSVFACGFPHIREIGASIMKPPKNLDEARAAVRASGYNGEKAVIINPTDFPSIGPHGELTADLLKKLGMNVELQEADWGTVVQRRTSREPVEKGGWSIFHTNSASIFLGSPALNYYIRGQGANGWFGWFENAQMEQLCNAWLDSSSDSEQDRLFDAIQQIAFDLAPVVPLGRFYVHTAYRHDLTGVIPAVLSFPWNIRRT